MASTLIISLLGFFSAVQGALINGAIHWLHVLEEGSLAHFLCTGGTVRTLTAVARALHPRSSPTAPSRYSRAPVHVRTWALSGVLTTLTWLLLMGTSKAAARGPEPAPVIFTSTLALRIVGFACVFVGWSYWQTPVSTRVNASEPSNAENQERGEARQDEKGAAKETVA